MAQIASGIDKAANLELVRRSITAAAEGGAELVVLPEYAMAFEDPMTERFIETAEDVDGSFMRAVGAVARDERIAVVIGINERSGDPRRCYNTVAVVDASGELIHTYRKLHLYDAFGDKESDWIRPGEHGGLRTFTVADLSFGVMTCYDLRFPELARQLVDLGADVLLLPSFWTPGPRKEDHWQTLSRARAIENTVYFVAVSQPSPDSTGGSLVVDPMGIVTAEMPAEAALAFADLSSERVAAARTRNPALTHRRFSISPTDSEMPALTP